MAESGHRARKSGIAPARVLLALWAINRCASALVLGQPGYDWCLEPSYFCATSFRNQVRMVSGLAAEATF